MEGVGEGQRENERGEGGREGERKGGEREMKKSVLL